jgi:LysM repeat protein
MKHVGTGSTSVQDQKNSSRVSNIWCSIQQYMHIHIIKTRCVVFLVSLALLLPGALLILPAQSVAYAANEACIWYKVLPRDTLSAIARRYQTTPQQLASLNHISNVNRIFAGQQLCIVNKTRSGLPPNNTGPSYTSHIPERSSRDQVVTLLRHAAAHYGLPANLLLAIAWQESGWQQHVIARDGGIGTMQLMPRTVQTLNTQNHAHYNPYKVADNITLGAIYLRTLWRGFHGNLTKVISAYNEGSANVIRHGIFNWRYVNSVLALMRKF